MAVTEQSKNRLHNHLEELLGDKDATTLMEMLPPTGWADVATRQDLQHEVQGLRKDVDGLRRETELRFEAIEQRMATKQDIAELRAHMDETLRKQLVTVVTCMVGLVTGMAGLLGAGAAIF